MGNAILAVVKEYVQFEDYPPQQQTKIVRKPVQITNPLSPSLSYDLRGIAG